MAAAAAEGDAVDGRDRGHGQALDDVHDAPNAPKERPDLARVHGRAGKLLHVNECWVVSADRFGW